MKMPHSVKVKRMPYILENLHSLLLVSLRSPRLSCLSVQQLLAFGSLMVTGTTRFSTENKGKPLFLKLSFTSPGKALQKSLGKTVIHVGTTGRCLEEVLCRGLFFSPCSSSPFTCRSWFLKKNKSFLYVVTVFEDIKIVASSNYLYLMMIGQKCTILIWSEEEIS